MINFHLSAHPSVHLYIHPSNKYSQVPMCARLCTWDPVSNIWKHQTSRKDTLNNKWILVYNIILQKKKPRTRAHWRDNWLNDWGSKYTRWAWSILYCLIVRMCSKKKNDGSMSKEHRSQWKELPKPKLEQFEQDK